MPHHSGPSWQKAVFIRFVQSGTLRLIAFVTSGIIMRLYRFIVCGIMHVIADASHCRCLCRYSRNESFEHRACIKLSTSPMLHLLLLIAGLSGLMSSSFHSVTRNLSRHDLLSGGTCPFNNSSLTSCNVKTDQHVELTFKRCLL